MDRFIGKKLDGRYEIRELVGIGGMSNVYKAYDVLEERIVAVKVLREEYMVNEELVRRFRNESKAIAVLAHPNIVKVYDVSFNKNIQSIVMEYIDGITLKDYIDQQGVLGWKSAVYFTVQLLRALQHAHDRGIVHRDIKPHNVMLLADGTIKVMDFGIARFSRSQSQTITDKAIGSVHYISPEQARGETTDDKADIYSVGVMLYEMLTGKLPFEADSPVSVALKQIQNTAVRPREINPNIPEGLEEITVRAMQKDPAKRYQSAAEMLRDIDEFKKNPTVNFEYRYFGDEEEGRRGLNKGRKNDKKDRYNRDGDEEIVEKRSMALPILAGITLAFVVVTVGFLFIIYNTVKPFEEVPVVTMPSLVGLDYRDVLSSSSYKDFDIQIEATEYQEGFAYGIIFEQVPRAGRLVRDGTVVKIKVSGGLQNINIPDYQSMESSLVFQQLTELGLAYTEKRVYSPTIASGYVIKTEPDKGVNVPTGTEIVVYVSMGKNNYMVDVPDLMGMSVEEARATLEALNLRIGNQNIVETEEYDPGTIVTQDPLPGVQISEASAINVMIAASKKLGGGSDIASEMRTLSCSVQMPTGIDWMVDVSAVQNDTIIQSERLIPAQATTWKVIVSGSGKTVFTVLIDSKPYRSYEVDFSNGSFRKIEDYSDNF